MKNISFALTTFQIEARLKFVTRRLRWLNLQPGELLQACEKCMGRKHGEPLVKLAVIRVVSVRREPLNRMALDEVYGVQEANLEGFPELSGYGFVKMFTKEMKCDPAQEVTRIAFEYVD